MRLFIPKEPDPAERRVPIVPADVSRLSSKGVSVSVETDIGATIHQPDSAYADAGAEVVSDRKASLSSAEVVARIRKPSIDELEILHEGCVHISFLDPFNERGLIETMLGRRITGISMEMIPRTTLAQKMDALSSQASLAGYVAVNLAAENLHQALPMMMTPAGTLKPARVFVIGAGVAGLQAIATAKRLGARVDAFDTRPVVEEQVQSLGAKFVKVDLGDTGQTKDGYAKELTAEQQKRQRDAMAKVCAEADVVITTAKLFGRKSPVIVTREMVESMKPGSVIVDLAIETGGNVEGAELDKAVEINGVTILGYSNLEGRVPVHASQMYSANVSNLLLEFWDEESKRFNLDPENEIVQGCVVTRDGELKNEMLREIYSKQDA
jgi:H+-translocating NAD(P) transhydrogenase subunit alpha